MTTPQISFRDVGQQRVLLVWAFLVAATIVSYFLTADDLVGNTDLLAAIVIGVSFFKVRLVVMHFMEISEAPVVLRMILEAYCLLVPLLLISLYLMG